MKNLNIENAKHTFFTDKQHYLDFRKAWADAVTSPKAKNTKTQWGWINSTHNLLFCILTEKNVLKAFTPVTNKNKLINGRNPFGGLDNAYTALRYLLDCTSRYQKYVSNAANKVATSTWQRTKGKTDQEVWVEHANQELEKLNSFLAPFNGTVTVETLLKLSEAGLFTETSVFGYTKQEKVKHTALTAPITHQMLWDMYTEG